MHVHADLKAWLEWQTKKMAILALCGYCCMYYTEILVSFWGAHYSLFQLMCMQGTNQQAALNDACTARVRMLGSDSPGAKGRHTSPKLRGELGWGKLKDGEDMGKKVKKWKAQSLRRPLK